MKHLVLGFCLLTASLFAQTGPRASYGMNEATGLSVVDNSGNGNTGTMTNGPTRVVGKYDSGIQFDGVNDFVQAADSNSLDITAAGTIEAWVKVSALNRWHSVIAKGNVNNDNAHNYALELNNLNRWQCALGAGGSSRLLSSTSGPAVNTWVHVACVWTGTQLRLYINGVQNATVTQNLTVAANTAPLYIGQFGGNADQLQGVIDEVRIYNRALTTAEIVTDMNTAIAPAPPPTGIKFGAGTFTGSVSVITQPPPPPPPPPSQSLVDLSWQPSPSPDVTSYKVYRSTQPGSSYNLLTTVGNTFSYTDSTVAPATTYYYVVTAIANGIESAFSNEATAVIP